MVTGAARTGRGSPQARRAAEDGDALERLVRRAFRHAARYYVEVARTPTVRPERVLEQLVIETPEVVEGIVSGGRPVIVVGAHFGAIEMPVSYLAARFGYQLVAPMETVADAGLQDWIERSRASAGIRIVPIEGARRTLLDELRAGRSIGLVADRDLTGGGLRVPFFGAPAPFPIGAALLAVETGAPLLVGGARRVGVGRYRGWLSRIEVPATGTRRERVHALVAAMAGRFEDLIAQAPEQWWAAFHPIWPDLEGAPDAPAPASRETAPGEVEVPA